MLRLRGGMPDARPKREAKPVDRLVQEAVPSSKPRAKKAKKATKAPAPPRPAQPCPAAARPCPAALADALAAACVLRAALCRRRRCVADAVPLRVPGQGRRCQGCQEDWGEEAAGAPPPRSLTQAAARRPRALAPAVGGW